MTTDSKKIEEILVNGGVVIMPTDTIYGILGKAFDENVVKRIYSLKRRNPENPCIILIKSIEDLGLFGIELNERQEEKVNELWSSPRPTSIIFDCSKDELSYIHRGTNTLALRLPKTDYLQELLSKTGPLIATSANPEGFPPARSAEEARGYFENAVDYYTDEFRIDEKHSKLIRLEKDGTINVLRD